MKIKKLTALLLALCLCVSMAALTGCAKTASEDADAAQPEDTDKEAGASDTSDTASPTDAETYTPEAEAVPVENLYGKITGITDKGWTVALFSDEGIDEKLEIEGLLFTGNMTDDKLTGETKEIVPADIDTINVQQEDKSWKAGGDAAEGMCLILSTSEDGTSTAWLMELDTTPVEDGTAA